MLKSKRWILPEGISETLSPEAMAIELNRRSLLDLFYSWGYDLVDPPIIDFYDSLLTGTGHDLELMTFTLTDQMSGQMLGVRADMTPQVARIDAHHIQHDTQLGFVILEKYLKLVWKTFHNRVAQFKWGQKFMAIKLIKVILKS